MKIRIERKEGDKSTTCTIELNPGDAIKKLIDLLGKGSVEVGSKKADKTSDSSLGKENDG